MQFVAHKCYQSPLNVICVALCAIFPLIDIHFVKIHHPPSTIYHPQSIIHNPQSIIHNPQSTIHNRMAYYSLDQQLHGVVCHSLALFRWYHSTRSQSITPHRYFSWYCIPSSKHKRYSLWSIPSVCIAPVTFLSTCNSVPDALYWPSYCHAVVHKALFDNFICCCRAWL